MKTMTMTMTMTMIAVVALAGACADGGEGEGEGEEGEEGEGEEGEGEEGEGEPCGTDDVLGGLELGAGFTVVDSADVDDDTALAGVGLDDPAAPILIGMRTDLIVVSFGSWPNIGAPAELFDALEPSDFDLDPAAFEVFPAFLVVDRLLIASAYSRGTDFNGFVGGHSLETGGTEFIPAVTPFSAVTIGDNLFVEAGGLDTVVEGAGVYAVGVGDVVQLGTLTPTAFTGYMASTPSGILVVGQFLTDTNELYAVAPVDLDAAFVDTPFDLAARTPFFTGGMGGVAGMGDGVAVLGVGDDGFTGNSVTFIGLTAAGTDVTDTAPVDVLAAGAGCTVVTQVAPFGDDVLVGLRDERGLRYVRVAQE